MNFRVCRFARLHRPSTVLKRKLYRRSAKGLETQLGSKHLDTLQHDRMDSGDLLMANTFSIPFFFLNWWCKKLTCFSWCSAKNGRKGWPFSISEHGRVATGWAGRISWGIARVSWHKSWRLVAMHRKLSNCYSAWCEVDRWGCDEDTLSYTVRWLEMIFGAVLDSRPIEATGLYTFGWMDRCIDRQDAW